jgi:hypothetical protein
MAGYPNNAGGLGALSAATSPQDEEQQLLSAWQSAQDLVRQQTKSNLDMILAGRDRIREARVGPSRSEQMLAIAAALGQPTRSGSFGETLGNVSGVLLENETAKRAAEEKRQEMLNRYGMDIGTEQLRMASTAADQAGDLYSRTAARKAAERKAAAEANKPATPVWAPNLNQFVSRDNPVPTPNKMQVGDITLTQYTDGNLYHRNADGSKDVYNLEGEKIGTIPAGGAR